MFTTTVSLQLKVEIAIFNSSTCFSFFKSERKAKSHAFKKDLKIHPLNMFKTLNECTSVSEKNQEKSTLTLNILNFVCFYLF